MEALEAVDATVTTRGRSAGPDPRRIERERPEQTVDVLGRATGDRTRTVRTGRDDAVAGRDQLLVLGVGQPDRHRVTIGADDADGPRCEPLCHPDRAIAPTYLSESTSKRDQISPTSS